MKRSRQGTEMRVNTGNLQSYGQPVKWGENIPRPREAKKKVIAPAVLGAYRGTEELVQKKRESEREREGWIRQHLQFMRKHL